MSTKSASSDKEVDKPGTHPPSPKGISLSSSSEIVKVDVVPSGTALVEILKDQIFESSDQINEVPGDTEVFAPTFFHKKCKKYNNVQSFDS